jgi:copper(I)-binding protein
MMQNDATAAAELGLRNPFVSVAITSPTVQGMLVRSVFFHCDGPGDATIALVDDDGQIVDSQVVHQIPEPATMMLLGLGGVLAAIRRKR